MPPRKITENMVSPQASPVQDQRVSPVPSVAAMSPLASVVTSPAQSTVQSVAAVSPLASMVMSPIQSMAVPHPASLAAVFKEMMDAAQVDGTIAPTMDEIEAKYEHRWAALDRPASPRPSHTPPRGPVLSEAAVQVAQAELQSAKSKMAVLEARAEWSESEVSSLKTLMHSMMQTMQGMQSIMSSNMAKGPEPSCSSSPGSIVSTSSRDSSGGSSLSSGQSRYKVRKDKHHQSKCYSLPPSSSSESDSEFESVSQAGSISSHGSRPSRNYEQDPRLPNFTGREAWKVWFTRFDDIATHQGWDKEKQLDVLLPKMQGAAGDYVFDELSREE